MPNIKTISQLLREGAYIVLLVFIMFASANISAMPAAPFPFSEVQPDGAEIMLHLRGDEHFSWIEDTNGYTVIKNNGWFEYAELGRSGHLVPNGIIVGRENPQALGLQKHVLPSETVRAEGVRKVKVLETALLVATPILLYGGFKLYLRTIMVH